MFPIDWLLVIFLYFVLYFISIRKNKSSSIFLCLCLVISFYYSHNLTGKLPPTDSARPSRIRPDLILDTYTIVSMQIYLTNHAFRDMINCFVYFMMVNMYNRYDIIDENIQRDFVFFLEWLWNIQQEKINELKRAISWETTIQKFRQLSIRMIPEVAKVFGKIYSELNDRIQHGRKDLVGKIDTLKQSLDVHIADRFWRYAVKESVVTHWESDIRVSSGKDKPKISLEASAEDANIQISWILRHMLQEKPAHISHKEFRLYVSNKITHAFWTDHRMRDNIYYKVDRSNKDIESVWFTQDIDALCSYIKNTWLPISHFFAVYSAYTTQKSANKKDNSTWTRKNKIADSFLEKVLQSSGMDKDALHDWDFVDTDPSMKNAIWNSLWWDLCRGSIEVRLSWLFALFNAIKGNMTATKNNTKNFLLLIKKILWHTEEYQEHFKNDLRGEATQLLLDVYALECLEKDLKILENDTHDDFNLIDSLDTLCTYLKNYKSQDWKDSKYYHLIFEICNEKDKENIIAVPTKSPK